MTGERRDAEDEVGPYVCFGCGAMAPADDHPGWRITDAAWCPKCGWLA